MMHDSDFDEFFHDFLMESAELLESYENSLLEIENALNHPDFDFETIQEHIRAIFRSVHTIKGLSGMIGMESVKNYAHEAEEVLDLVRHNEIALNDELIELMFDILDTIKNLIHTEMAGETGDQEIERSAEIQRLAKFLEKSAGITQDAPEPPESIGEERERFSQLEESTMAFIEERENESPGFDKETEYDRAENEDEDITNPRRLTSNATKSTAIRVDTDRLDMLLDTVGELVIGKNRLLEVSQAILNWREHSQGMDESDFLQEGTVESDLSETVDHLTDLIENLQETSMKLRMVPVGYTFKKFHRLVRDLAKNSGKQIQLGIKGEATEVDRAVIESMEDPLLHIIRNAIDHGIELPEDRVEQGKHPVGMLKLSAFQEDNAIVIYIDDDGKGIDPEKVYKKAISARLVSPNLHLSERDMLNLIFLPGLSTASSVSDISGRGVGMDVVKKNILKLNGIVDIQSQIGVGTTVTLKLPLTLAIIRALLVRVGEERYSIPVSNVVETRSIFSSDIQHINEREAVTIRDSILPIVRLNKALGIKGEPESGKIFIVVAGIGERRIGFVVDGLINQQDIVIKPLGDYLKNTRGFAGATILGNGDVSLVLDLDVLWQDEIYRISPQT